MATERRIWADVRKAEDDPELVGSCIGSAVAAGQGGSLAWWFAKAGIDVDTPPTTGQGWPR